MLIYFVTTKNLKHKYNLKLHFSFPAIQFLVVHSLNEGENFIQIEKT